MITIIQMGLLKFIEIEIIMYILAFQYKNLSFAV